MFIICETPLYWCGYTRALLLRAGGNASLRLRIGAWSAGFGMEGLWFGIRVTRFQSLGLRTASPCVDGLLGLMFRLQVSGFGAVAEQRGRVHGLPPRSQDLNLARTVLSVSSSGRGWEATRRRWPPSRAASSETALSPFSSWYGECGQRVWLI